ncbi:hypothetical protein [Mesorhizobium sp. M1A.T.Ca.IN.004.03.1.1]|nr:hypothetical protein [Mesorhizobium sp. M1A.T.Ca.IN.004.03.1.1]
MRDEYLCQAIEEAVEMAHNQLFRLCALLLPAAMLAGLLLGLLRGFNASL